MLIKQLVWEIYGQLKSVRGSPRFAKSIDYDEYWRKRHFIPVQPRYPIMAELVEARSTVLDVGCGDGGFLSFLKARKEVRELGIDISGVAVEQCLAHGLNSRRVTLAEIAAECAVEDCRFDVVVMSEVIEHVANAEKFIQVAWDLATRRLILSFPNIAFWPHRLRLLFGRNPVQWVHFQAEHLRFWSLPDFVEWIAAMDLPAARVHTIVATSGTRLFRLYRRWPNLFGNQIIVVIERQ